MKKLKYILTSFVLALVLIVPALALVGCAKHFKISISIAAGVGDVTTVNQLTHVKKSLVGTNDVEEGSKFEYSVVPQTGYEIDYIKVDGNTLEKGTDYSISDLSVDKTYGIARLLLSESVNADHTIVVAFKLREYYLISYEYYDATEEVYKPLLKADGSVYTKTVERDEENRYTFDTTGYNAFGMRYLDHELSKEGSPVYTAVEDNAATPIGYDTVYRTDKTEAELKTFLGL
ncbi:MAG: hypothetical protein IJ542_02440 [Clostridia bacterium]|nr:hypothetical protein [Clostridia bacterium]